METPSNKASSKSGLIPGTLIHIGNKKTDKIKLTEFTFDESEFKEIEIDDIEHFNPSLNKDIVTWLNMDGIHKVEVVEKIGDLFGLHKLLLEDVLNTQHRPKAEYYEGHLFFTLKMLGLNKTKNKIVSEQVSIVLGKEYLVSFQEKEGDLFEQVRNRIRTKKGKIRQKKSDYLFYALIDAVVDNYFLIIENFSERVEELEEQVLINPNEGTLGEIQKLKKQLIILRKAVYPLREAISSIVKDDENLFDNENAKYLRDVYDHTLHIIDGIESQRDVVSGLKDLYISEISNRMNNTMKVLTIIATIFIPLTFIAGIYGMNFENMPELHAKWGYFGVLGVMIVITIGMIVYFKKKKWL
jgi:magnesium transporter